MDNHFNYKQLRKLIEKRFDLEELRTLCFDLNINYDELSGDRLSTKTVALVEYMRRFGQMPQFMEALENARPVLDWPGWKQNEETALSISSQSILSSNPDNPFGRSGSINELKYYLVRQPITDSVIVELQKGVSLSITGSSQTGKSSLLWYIKQFGPELLGLPSENFIYLNMELIHNEEEFFDFICYELGIQSARGYPLARKLQSRKIVLCLDEIEKMTWEDFSLNVRTELRGLADGAKAPFTLVIASRSSLHQLFPDSPEMTSPLAGLCMQVNLPFFTKAEAHALVTYYLNDSSKILSLDEVDKAWEKTQGHPRKLQLALKQAYNQMNKYDK